MKKCKQCGRTYEYNESVGYAEDLCSSLCDGIFTQKASNEQLNKEQKTEIERLRNRLEWVHRNIDRIRDWDFVPGGVILVVDRIQSEMVEALGADPRPQQAEIKRLQTENEGLKKQLSLMRMEHDHEIGRNLVLVTEQFHTLLEEREKQNAIIDKLCKPGPNQIH